MVAWSGILGFAVLCGAVLAAPMPKLWAATSDSPDIILDDAPSASVVDLGRVKPIPAPKKAQAQPLPGANPLWAIPFSVLTAARERPIFSPSRRPQPAAVAPAVDPIRVPAPQQAKAPERPPLALIGAAVGLSGSIAVFLDRTNQKIVRLRPGETYAGWLLSAVLQRKVTVKKEDRTETLVLGASGSPAGTPGASAAAGLVMPAADGAGTSFAPFVPRSTPKHGEPDGL